MMKPRGTSLLELLLSTGIAAFLTLALVLLFTHSHTLFLSQGSQSEALRTLGLAMHKLTSQLTQGSVYLVNADDGFLLGKPSSQITIEQFSSLYHADTLFTLAFENHRLIEKAASDSPVVLASNLQSASFAFKPPNVLQITLQANPLILQTEIPTVRIAASQ